MGIGISVFLMAVGAILAFAVDVSTEGFDLNTIGVILMVVGAIGLLTSMFIWGPRSRTTVVEDDAYVDRPVGRRRVYRESEL